MATCCTCSHEYRADLLHLFTGERALLLDVPAAPSNAGFAGPCTREFRAVSRRLDHEPPASLPGLCRHVRARDRPRFGRPPRSRQRPNPDRAVRPYAFGHADQDVMPSPRHGDECTWAMSSRSSRLRGSGPGARFSASRTSGTTSGRFRRPSTSPCTYSDYLRSLDGVPAPPSDLRVRFEGGASVCLTWRDNAPDADGYEVFYQWPYARGRDR